MNEKEFAELAAGYALHALSAAEEQRYVDALVARPEGEELVSADMETAAMLADAATPVTPPSSIRDALLAQIATTPQHETTPQHAVRQPYDDASPEPDAVLTAEERSEVLPARAARRWGRTLFTLAASLVLIVGVGVGVSVLVSQLNRPASVVALEQIESAADAQQATVELESGALATAHWSEAAGNAVLVTEGLESLGDDQTYQLWFVRGDDAVPAGLFETDAGEATALLDEPMHEGDVIAVTVEEAGGSPTGVPTTTPIIVIPTA